MFAWSVPFLQATFDVIRHWFDAVLLETKFTKAVEEQLDLVRDGEMQCC